MEQERCEKCGRDKMKEVECEFGVKTLECLICGARKVVSDRLLKRNAGEIQ